MQIRRDWKMAGALWVAAVLLATAQAQVAMQKQADKDKARDEKAEAPKKAKVGEKAPDFTLTDQEGKEHKLSDLKDKIVILEWINYQCPWSRASADYNRKLAEKYADNKEIVWLAIDSTHGRTAEQDKRYRKEAELPYPILLDKDGEIGHLYGAATTPHMYVIDKGTLVYAGALHNDQFGRKSADEKREYVAEAVAAVLAGKDVPISETKPWGCSVKYAPRRDQDKKK